jgi:hypothetical protein
MFEFIMGLECGIFISAIVVTVAAVYLKRTKDPRKPQLGEVN